MSYEKKDGNAIKRQKVDFTFNRNKAVETLKRNLLKSKSETSDLRKENSELRKENSDLRKGLSEKDAKIDRLKKVGEIHKSEKQRVLALEKEHNLAYEAQEEIHV